MYNIKENILNLRKRIASVCSKINKAPESIKIVAVSKGRTPEQIKEAIEAGIIHIGESRVQEASSKYQRLGTNCDKSRPVSWHMVGHLQTNKAKDAVMIFDLIQSVDSLRLAQEIDKQAGRINKIQDVLIEVKTSSEDAKFGLVPEEATEAFREIAKLKNVRIHGLMTVAPLIDDPEKSRPCFRTLRTLRDELSGFGIWDPGFGTLSMGMTDDFEVAIEEGADMIRLGRAIFGN